MVKTYLYLGEQFLTEVEVFDDAILVRNLDQLSHRLVRGGLEIDKIAVIQQDKEVLLRVVNQC
ncbi:hypothetical protein COL154_006855 [Colletotrichum chrysophilum]|nr:hypothetical protein COL154_006855 [Colletotrichum chrysophilum]